MYEHGNNSWLWVVVIVVFIVVLVIVFYAASDSQKNPLFLGPSAGVGRAQLLNLPNTILPLTLGQTPLKNVKCPVQLRTPIFQALQTEEEASKSVIFPSKCLKGSVRLSGEQEVPPVKTKGKGKGYVIVDSEGEKVYYDIRVKNLSSEIDESIGVHFHLGARGENGPILKDLVVVESSGCKFVHLQGDWTPEDATQPLTQKDLDALLNGDVYVNVHTLNFPDGEVRGQVRF
jgi:hypothetical protein